jgi:hypothetical protein
MLDAEETLLYRIEEKKLQWFGHLMRMEDERWPHRIFQRSPVGKKKRGRPP